MDVYYPDYYRLYEASPGETSKTTGPSPSGNAMSIPPMSMPVRLAKSCTNDFY